MAKEKKLKQRLEDAEADHAEQCLQYETKLEQRERRIELLELEIVHLEVITSRYKSAAVAADYGSQAEGVALRRTLEDHTDGKS